MSWIDRLENINFTITTGDGKKYEPLWKNGEKSTEFNISKYDFINVEGSLIERKKPQGSKYPLVFWFQGDDNIEQSNDFELSSKDNRLWIVEHPIYGTIKGQPTNIKRNDTNYNVTEISVDFWQSVSEDYPNADISISDDVQSKVDAINQTSINTYVENAKPSTSDINTLKQTTNTTASKFEPDNDSFTDYSNVVNTAIKSLDSLVIDTENAISSIQEVVNKPAFFVDSVSKKVNSYINAFNELKTQISNLASKYYFEAQGASILNGMCVSMVNPNSDDYITRNDIEEINTILLNTYNEYLEILDNNQISIYDVGNTWNPNVNIQLQLLELITLTSNNLFSLSFNAKQERTIELKKDSNLIILTHKFVGLDADDVNIIQFRERNNIKNNELFTIKKGRSITYFV